MGKNVFLISLIYPMFLSSEIPTKTPSVCEDLTRYDDCRNFGCGWSNEKCVDNCYIYEGLRINGSYDILYENYTYEKCYHDCQKEDSECLIFMYSKSDKYCQLYYSIKTLSISTDQYSVGVCSDENNSKIVEESNSNDTDFQTSVSSSGLEGYNLIFIVAFFVLCILNSIGCYFYYVKNKKEQKDREKKRFPDLPTPTPS
eukprot:UN23052